MQAHQSCQLDLPLSLCSFRLWSCSSFFFLHAILFQLKSPKPSIYHTVSHCVYIPTSALWIFHTVYYYISAANSWTVFNYIMLCQCTFFPLYQPNKLQEKRNLRAGKLHGYCISSVSRSLQQLHCSCWVNMHVKYNLLATVSLLLLSVWQTEGHDSGQLPISPLSLKAAEGRSVLERSGHFGQISVLPGKEEHFPFSSTYFRG